MFYQEGRTVKLDLNDHFKYLKCMYYVMIQLFIMHSDIVEIITTISLNPSNNILFITNILYFNLHVTI